MSYVIRAATMADVLHAVHHREQMFREMGTTCDYDAMARACEQWYRTALPAGTYRGWMIERDRLVVGGGGLIVMPWSPGPSQLDPRMAWVFNVFIDTAHRGQGLAHRLMETIHAWCREQGIERLALNATESGARVYRAFGYATVNEPMLRLDL